MRRRAFMSLPLIAAVARESQAKANYPPVLSGKEIRFPRDHGAHPEFRTEWWYITGVVRTESGKELGIQVTFFRSRPGLQDHNPSRFAPKQLLFAHAAIADPAHGRLRHDQRAARAGFELAYAAEDDTNVRIDEWTLVRKDGLFRSQIVAREFSMDLSFEMSQPILLQGQAGFSQKGVRVEQASYYYSVPHLKTQGTVVAAGKTERVIGTAWMDHEWSSEIMTNDAVGWDWTGINVTDGSALMAFRMRNQNGDALYAGGSVRTRDGQLKVLRPDDIKFEPVRQWRSSRTGGSYPVAMKVTAGEIHVELQPVMDDQELDSRGSVGAVYWEGAVKAMSNAQVVGQGYLELTGYFRRLRF